MTKEKGSVTGTVTWAGNSKPPVPVSGATVCAVGKKGTIATNTNAEGVFNLGDLPIKDPLVLIGLHHGAKPSDPYRVVFDAGSHDQKVKTALTLKRIGGTPNNFAGMIFWLSCILMVTALCYLYWYSHQNSFASKSQTRIIKSIGDADKLLPAMVAKEPKTLDAFDKYLQSTIDMIKADDRSDNFSKKVTITQIVDSLQTQQTAITALEVGEKPAQIQLMNIEKEITKLKKALSDLSPSYFWTSKPWSYVELWCWGLLGLLTQKIMRVGWYLRSNQYFQEGTWMHVAHLVAVPILGVIGTLILSMIQFKTASGIVVDLSHPQAMVITAFLMCVYPWKLYDFIRAKGAEVLKIN